MYSFDTPSWITLSSADFTSILFENDFKALLPEIFLVTASIILLVYGVIGSTSPGYPLLIGNISWLALFSLIITFSLINAAPLNCGYLFYNSLVQDDYTFFLRSRPYIGSNFFHLHFIKLPKE